LVAHGCGLQIYNERIYDLQCENTIITSSGGGSTFAPPKDTSLAIRESASRGVYVEGLNEQNVGSASQAQALLALGIRNRRVAATAMNHESSRSHSVFTLTLEAQEKKNGVLKSRLSAFHLIDLAGSERQKSTGTTGERLREASQINKSLSSLAGVIGALVDIAQGKQRHVHYRDSKLTHLLRDSLGGNSKTSLIATVSPTDDCYPETLATLKFAESAKLVRLSTCLFIT
jgi:kinesin family protein 15